MDEFDIIIVGAGSAGCVVAGRLAEAGAGRILLLEAGGSDRRLWIRVPIGYGKTFDDPRVNWCYRSAPDPHTGDRRHYFPRGKVLGGSGAINAMVWARGHPSDYDDWAAPGWSGAAAWAAFDAIETREAGKDAPGRLKISDPSRDHHPITRAFVAAAGEAGFATIADLNAAPHEGVAPYAITVAGGRRWTSADAWLRPALAARRITLETHALVDRIAFDAGRASAVIWRRGGVVRHTRARCGVVLCAGAVGSPAILMRSGMGPGAVLADAGIAVTRENAAVGANLQDHLGINYHFRAHGRTLNATLGTLGGQIGAALRYALARRGPLALSMNQIGGLVRSDPALDRPDVQLYFNPISYSAEVSGHKTLLRPDPWQGFIIGFNTCRPRSRGAVTIGSGDPGAAPIIAPRYLSAHEDCTAAIAAARVVARLAQTPSLGAITHSPHGFTPQGASDAAILADFRERSGTVHHLCGTCRMAPAGEGGVVDPRLRVHGVAGLRVIDASVFPTIPSANTNAPVVMTAWRAAAMMLEDIRQ